MTGEEWIAKECARHWSKPPPSENEQEAIAHAYLMGFRKGKERAARLITKELPSPLFRGMGVLIEAIETAKVDLDTGERIE